MRILSVQVGRPRALQREGRSLRTGFEKKPVVGRVNAALEGLDGDGQADRRYHGGADQAVLAYSASHYARWREELGWPGLGPGGFGENLTVEGVDEETACIGDAWRAGGAVLEVSCPRIPCAKIARFWERPELLRIVQESGRSGWYLRVVEEGGVAAGDALELVARPNPGWTIARATAVFRARKADAASARELRELSALGERWRKRL